MSLKSRARKLQHATGLSYQQALSHLKALHLDLADEIAYVNGVVETVSKPEFAESGRLLATGLKREPHLTEHGLEPGTKSTRASVNKSALTFSAAVLRQVALCSEWLATRRQLPEVIRGETSCEQVQHVERWAKENGRPPGVTNGAFIAAALGMDLKYEICAPSIWTNAFGDKEYYLMKPMETLTGMYSKDDVWDMMGHVPRGLDLLVAASDPEYGPYTKMIAVPEADIEQVCGPRWNRVYRRIDGYEIDAMIGEIEDFTEGWRHSE